MELDKQISPATLVESEDYSATINEMYRAVYVCIYNMRTNNSFELHLRDCFYNNAEARSNKSKYLLHFLNSVNWEENGSWKDVAAKLSGETDDTHVEKEFDLLDVSYTLEYDEPLRDYDKEETEREILNEYYGESSALAESGETGWYYSDDDATYDGDSNKYSNLSDDYADSTDDYADSRFLYNNINNPSDCACSDDAEDKNQVDDDVLSMRRETAVELLNRAEELELEAADLRRQAIALLEGHHLVPPLAVNACPAEIHSRIDDPDVPD